MSNLGDFQGTSEPCFKINVTLDHPFIPLLWLNFLILATYYLGHIKEILGFSKLYLKFHVFFFFLKDCWPNWNETWKLSPLWWGGYKLSLLLTVFQLPLFLPLYDLLQVKSCSTFYMQIWGQTFTWWLTYFQTCLFSGAAPCFTPWLLKSVMHRKQQRLFWADLVQQN